MTNETAAFPVTEERDGVKVTEMPESMFNPRIPPGEYNLIGKDGHTLEGVIRVVEEAVFYAGRVGEVVSVASLLFESDEIAPTALDTAIGCPVCGDSRNFIRDDEQGVRWRIGGSNVFGVQMICQEGHLFEIVFARVENCWHLYARLPRGDAPLKEG